MFSLKKSVLILIGTFLMAGAAFGQGQQQQQAQSINPDSVSDKELKKFANAANEIQGLQRDAQKQLMSILDEEGMQPQRFQKIMMSQQNPQMAQNVQVTEKEEKIIQKIQPKLMKINQQMRQQQMKVIQEKEITMQRFNNLAQAIRSNKELNQRFMEIVNDTTANGN